MQLNKLNSVTISLEIEFSMLNDRLMCVDVVCDEFMQKVKPDGAGIYVINLSVDLPTTIQMIFSGKNQDLDTVIDQQGEITGDLYVKFKKLSLDGIDVNTPLDRIIHLVTVTGQEIYTDYIGFNGQICLDLHEHNVFDQIMVWDRRLDHG